MSQRPTIEQFQADVDEERNLRSLRRPRRRRPATTRRVLESIADEDLFQAAATRTVERRLVLLLQQLGFDRWRAWRAANILLDHPRAFTEGEWAALRLVADRGLAATTRSA